MANIFLYHGSNQRIDNPQWNIGSKGRDFGKCFYTTYNKPTAKNWAKKLFGNDAIVNKYAIDLEKLCSGCLNIKRFVADAEWAEFIYNNRYNDKFKRPEYDIIIGPIADKGLKKHFSKIKTENKSFSDIANLIEYNKFKSLQVGFCSNKAINMLNFTD
ncbi:MAG: DUF3990 domain-containing protein [Phocaeicola sp.]|nr:DUF3990 domain-containing protein [Phocaeicola sp.]